MAIYEVCLRRSALITVRASGKGDAIEQALETIHQDSDKANNWVVVEVKQVTSTRSDSD
jgi:hypothetical protein